MIYLPSEFIKKSEKLPVVDVRTPAEFDLGHIPGAVNIPLFSNEERAIVGTIYKRQGKEAAVLKGLEFVGPKMKLFVDEAKKIADDKQILVHCWRGGMRSSSMAWLFNSAGLMAHTLLGGYKAYRRYNRELFDKENHKIIVLGGFTGSGKTNILKELALLGEQVIDLEGIAHHKGSAFGHIGELPQPTSEQFENNLGRAWQKLDFKKVIWLEDESRAIGHIFQLESIYNLIRNSPLFFIDVPIDIRINNLVADYAGIDAEALKVSLNKIVKRLGNDNFKKASIALDENDYATVAKISLRYYDKAYGYGVGQRDQDKVISMKIENYNVKEIAKQLIIMKDQYLS